MRRVALIVPAVCAAALSVAAPVAAAAPTVVSRSDSGALGTGSAFGSAVSADGRYVAFTSDQPLTGVLVTSRQLYVRDRQAGRTILASATPSGEPGDAAVDDPPGHRAYAISGDGRYVVFSSTAANLDPAEADGNARDVFRKDLATGALTTVSRAPDGSPANAAVGGDPDVSYDGSRVVYETGGATNLWIDDPSAQPDIVMRDLTAPASTLVSAGALGGPLTGTLQRAAISADGDSVAFEDDIAVMLRNVASGTTATIADPGANPDLSGDGRVVVYESAGQVMRRRSALPPDLVSGGAEAPTVSANGERVAFVQTAAFPGDATGAADVFVWDGGTPVRVSVPESNNASSAPALSADAGLLAFDLDDGNPSDSPDPADTNHRPDVLAASMTPIDANGPDLVVGSPITGATLDAPSVTVAGTVADPSGIVDLRVEGSRVRPAGGAFAVEVPLAVGVNRIAVRAVDGSGNAIEIIRDVTRPAAAPPPLAPKSRARKLSVIRIGRATYVRYTLDAGATRVAVRLWRRVQRAGAQPMWTPATAARKATARAGRRRALLVRRRVPAGVYQVRVTVASAGGVAVAALRLLVPRQARTR